MIRRELDHGWVLSATRVASGGTDPGPVSARAPGCVHTDLLGAGLIPDPLAADHEARLAWIGESDWAYETTFTLTTDEVPELVFDGLDTLATVSLNGAVLGTTQNMHRSYRFDLAGFVQPGANVLRVEFASAVVEAERRREVEGVWPAASFGRPYNYVRKMACSWGWDWGPWLTSAGIWRAVALEWSSARLDSVRPSVRLDGSAGRVDVLTRVVGDGSAAVVAVLTSPGGQEVARCSQIVTGASAALRLDVEDAQRWHPHSMGAQPRYRLDVELRDEAGDVLDVWSRQIGFRSFALDTRNDAIGSAFTFVVNDIPIFAKGVNWIPADVFPSRVTRSLLRSRLQDAVDAGVDLVRIWGGGIYESEDFYDLCDELGLMVWQDFCFACAAYPEHLLHDEVDAEAREQVERLMPHPSLVLWNGNNENIWGWHDWGWRRVLDGRPWGATWYFETLPRIVQEIDPDRPYWAGSPYSGPGDVHPNADTHGCSHLWDVWNVVDYERYRAHVPRFAAEFGWQAPPAWSTLERAVGADELRVDSHVLAVHQKADRGERKLNRGLEAHVGVPRSFDAWLWATQLMQARAVATGVEHLRSWRGRCMGSIWWQLNDCWPSISWAVVDVAGQRKPAWYALRRAHAPRLATVQPRGDSLALFLVNDAADEWEAQTHVRRVHVDGSVLHARTVHLVVPSRSVRHIELDAELAAPADPTSELLVVDTVGAARATWWFVPDLDVALPHKELTASVTLSGDAELTVDVHARQLLVDVALFPDRLIPGAQVDDMLVTLLPGESRQFRIALPAGTDPAALEPSCFASTPVLWTVNSLLAMVGLPPTR